MAYQSVLIHLSDLECGANNRATREDIVDGYRKAADQLVADVSAQVKKQITDGIDLGLIVTGDIADTGAVEEYEHAAEVIERIQEALKIPNDLVALVPGNHDVSWPDCRKAFSAAFPGVDVDKKEDTGTQRETVRNSKAKLANFGKLFERICGRPFPGPESAIAFEGFTRLGIALIGLDSTLPCTFRPEDNHGLIRDDQISSAKVELDKLLAANKDLLPIAAMHHCPFALTEETVDGGSYLHSGDEVIRLLSKAGFSAIMCGHEHKPKALADLYRGLQVYVTGTYGLNAEHLVHRYKTVGYAVVSNKYSIILYSSANASALMMRQLREPGAVNSDWITGPDSPPLIPIWLKRPLRVSAASPNLRDDLQLHPGFPTDLPGGGKGGHFFCVCIEAVGDALRSVRSVTYRVADKERVSESRESAFLVDFVLDNVNGKEVEAEIVTEGGDKIRLTCLVPCPIAH